MPEKRAWYSEWFNHTYLKVYAHRNVELAESEVSFIVSELGLSKSDRILDLGCGAGRHLIRLQELGFERLVGFDLSPDLLAAAQQGVKGETSLVRGDMRALPFHGTFQAVLSLFTSFGYFEEDEENLRVLHEIRDALKLDGRVLLDLPSYGVAERLVPESERQLEGFHVHEKRRYDMERKRIEKEIVVTDSEGIREFFESVRVYFFGEIMKMFAAADLAIEAIYGDFLGAEFDPRGDRMIVIGRRTEVPAHLIR